MKKLLYGMIAVATIFSLTGCGNKEETTEPVTNTPETQTESTVETTQSSTEEEMTVEEAIEQLPEERIAELQETLENVEVSSDSNTITFKQDEVTTSVYHHDGEKITGFEVFIEYETQELAEAAKAEGEADPEAMQAVESVKVEENKLHVVFNESAYADTTLEQVQQAYQAIQVIQGK